MGRRFARADGGHSALCFMVMEDFFSEALTSSYDHTSYFVSRRLAEMYHGKAVVEGETSSFDLDAYVRAQLCSIVRETRVHNQFVTEWRGAGKPLRLSPVNAWLDVLWRGQLLEVLILHYSEAGCWTRHFWIVADEREIAEGFFRSVCDWSAEVRGEILVYEGGYWQKDAELFRAIKSASFENLVVPAALRAELEGELERFFAAREVYEKYGVPWKRGVLLTGPPGNGKTHAVKALINQSRRPCLYVKSFKSSYDTDQDNMREVFTHARRTAPCVLVFEDLDSLLDDENRSLFLNELDGFATNTGLVVLATTNHPERLDPAIMDRPSRFDRKYHFELPAEAERLTFISAWNAALQEEMRLSAKVETALAAATDGFSFAYLKELFVSSMMQWIGAAWAGGMDEIAVARVELLRQQMKRAKTDAAATKTDGKDSAEGVEGDSPTDER
ncbi:MAG: AAA family ATPase [Pyrinomonadaceae bacterium]